MLLLLSACMGLTPEKKEKQKSPNIIFILTDDQGWTHTSHRQIPIFPNLKVTIMKPRTWIYWPDQGCCLQMAMHQTPSVPHRATV